MPTMVDITLRVMGDLRAVRSLSKPKALWSCNRRLKAEANLALSCRRHVSNHHAEDDVYNEV
jgi:hypothetical protein